MASRYHLNYRGEPAVCKAQSDASCRAIEDSERFHGSLEEVATEAENRNREIYGDVAPSTRKSESSSVRNIRQVQVDDLVDSTRRVELKQRIQDFEESELGSEFYPGSVKMNRDGLGFVATAEEDFSYGDRSFRRGDIVSFDSNMNIV